MRPLDGILPEQVGSREGPTRTGEPTAPRSWFRDPVCRQLERLEHGCLRLREGTSVRVFGRTSGSEPLAATLTVRDPRFYRALALGGDLGAADAYTARWWECDDLVALCRIAVQNVKRLETMNQGWARPANLASRLVHALDRNTRKGSRRNIASHYDLGNDFFRLFLDETLSYSCAIFPRPDATLQEASVCKLDRICRKLDLQPQDHLLEIGTGWGGLALHAAGTYGCRVTTTTLSREQYGLAGERVREAGLEDRVQVLLEDYRDLRGSYDKLVSVEMIEAVGHAFYDDYFRACSRLLHDRGAFLLQAITIGDRVYDRARRSVDFIKARVFPGSCIPSVGALGASVARASDLRPFHLEDIGPHYAQTLRAWRRNFHANRDRIAALGYDEPFLRTWDYYLAYCEAGFTERWISDVQVLYVKPGNRQAPILPDLGRSNEGGRRDRPAPVGT